MIWILNFVATDIYGNRINVDSLMKEKHVILDFWATWCNHCDEELDKLNEAFGDREDVIIVAISQDTKRNINRVRQMAKAHGWNFPIIIDEGKKLSSRYGVFGLPTVMVFQRGGHLKKRIYGFNPRLIKLIKEALNLQ
ncbi:MAG: TlpA family protein disulfide reductase [Thermotogae bacterium]|nr:TlpA family protein disulfide reductase [Thermotogota bacterium]